MRRQVSLAVNNGRRTTSCRIGCFIIFLLVVVLLPPPLPLLLRFSLCRQLYASRGFCFRVVHSAVRPCVVRRSVNLTPIPHDAWCLFTPWRDFNEIWQKWSTYGWPLLKRFSRSKVKDQHHSETKCTFAEKAYMSTVWRASRITCSLYVILWPLIPF